MVINKKAVLTVAFILLFLGVVFAPQKAISVPTYARTLSPFNVDPFGTSGFIGALNESGYKIVFGDPAKLRSYGKGDLYVLLGPDVKLTRGEVEDIRDFFNRGGNLLIADELGLVNDLIDELFGARINEEYVNLTWTLNSIIRSRGIKYSFNVTLHLTHVITATLLKVANQPTALTLLFTATVETSLPSYFEKLGSLKPIGYTYVHDLKEGDLNNLEERIGEYLLGLRLIKRVYAACYGGPHELYDVLLSGLDVQAISRGGPRAIIVADTSLFINDRNVKSIAIGWVRWLTDGGGTIIVDVAHYKANVVTIPLPRYGDIVLSILNTYAEKFTNVYNSIITATPFPLVLLLLLAALISSYLSYRSLIKVPSIYEQPINPVVELNVIKESPFLRSLKRGIRGKKAYMAMTLNLYGLLNDALKYVLNVGIDDIAKDDRVLGEIKDKYGFSDLDILHLRRVINRLKKLKGKIENGRAFPLVISWRRTFVSLVKDVDYMLGKFKIEFSTPRIEGVKIEYIAR